MNPTTGLYLLEMKCMFSGFGRVRITQMNNFCGHLERGTIASVRQDYTSGSIILSVFYFLVFVFEVDVYPPAKMKQC